MRGVAKVVGTGDSMECLCGWGRKGEMLGTSWWAASPC